MVSTNPARDVFAGYTSGGAAREVDNAEVIAWAEGIERAAGSRFDTVSSFQSTSVPPSVSVVDLMGYALPGDVNSIRLKRADSEPSYGGIRSTDRYLSDGTEDATNGGWWEIASNPVDIRAFGATGDGSADDRTALYNANAAGKTIILQDGYTFRIASDLTLDVDVIMLGSAKFSIDSGVTLTIEKEPIASMSQLFTGDGDVVFGEGFDAAYPDWFAATVNGVADNATAIQKCHAACVTNRVEFNWVNRYATQSEIAWDTNVPSRAQGGSALFGLGTGVAGITIDDGTYLGQNSFPYINGFVGHGLKLEGTDLAQINVPIISNCGSAIIIETRVSTHATSVDNLVEVMQIGACDKGIVFDVDHLSNIMQGNRLYCNFCLSTKYSVYFESTGLSGSTDWDSNFFEFEAVDPLPALTDAVFIYNPNSSLSVDKQVARINTWAGGFASTAKLIDGKFSNLKFYVNSAQAWTWGQIDLVGTNNVIGLNDVMGSPNSSIACTLAANSRASFNGGACVYKNKVKLKVTLTSNLVNHGTLTAYAYHLATDQFTNLFFIGPSDEGFSQSIDFLSVRDNSATNANEIVINLKNTTGATINSGTTIFFTLFVGGIGF